MSIPFPGFTTGVTYLSPESMHSPDRPGLGWSDVESLEDEGGAHRVLPVRAALSGDADDEVALSRLPSCRQCH